MDDPFDVMPPWDAATWFQAPTEGPFISLLGGAVTKVVTADPLRVALGFATSNGTVKVSINAKTLGGGQTGGGGWPLNFNQIGGLWLLFKDVGPLVMSDWFALSDSGANLTVWEVKLKDWPQAMQRRINRVLKGRPAF